MLWCVVEHVSSACVSVRVRACVVQMLVVTCAVGLLQSTLSIGHFLIVVILQTPPASAAACIHQYNSILLPLISRYIRCHPPTIFTTLISLTWWYKLTAVLLIHCIRNKVGQMCSFAITLKSFTNFYQIWQIATAINDEQYKHDSLTVTIVKTIHFTWRVYTHYLVTLQETELWQNTAISHSFPQKTTRNSPVADKLHDAFRDINLWKIPWPSNRG